MKKVVIIALSLMFSLSIIAQDTSSDELVSKKGYTILPKTGDYAFGIDAMPILNMTGNFIKINSGGAFASPALVDFYDGAHLFFKYYTTSKQAYRVSARLYKTSATTKTNVPSVADPAVMVTDKSTASSGGIHITAGLENRAGQGRFQAYYGAQGVLQLQNAGKVKNTYADAISATNPVASRLLKSNAGLSIGVGADAFVGAEFFFAPKISVGGELGWGLLYTTQLKSTSTVEGWNGTANVETETEAPNGSSLNIDNNNFFGGIHLLFHF